MLIQLFPTYAVGPQQSGHHNAFHSALW